ncbi:hypothetical protein LUZ60_014255 [Juncus effusus]|nr:hypothetical protein LUZ60_014255 [Juncus effusus]
MSSPARSSVSAASGGATAGGSIAGGGVSAEDAISIHLVPEIALTIDRKEYYLSVLELELKEALDKEVKSLDDDNWKFTHPRSNPNLFYKPPGSNLIQAQKQTGNF